jgi:hypothetical protein
MLFLLLLIIIKLKKEKIIRDKTVAFLLPQLNHLHLEMVQISLEKIGICASVETLQADFFIPDEIIYKEEPQSCSSAYTKQDYVDNLTFRLF